MSAAGSTLTEKEMTDASGFAPSRFPDSRAEVIHGAPETITTLLSVPDELLYAGSIHPELRTVEAFKVNFQRMENGYAAVVREIDEYGLGDTRSEALEDLRRTIQELYLSLEGDESRLSGDLLSVWTRLKQHVKRIHR